MILDQTDPVPKVLVLLYEGAVGDRIMGDQPQKLSDSFRKQRDDVRMHKEKDECDSKESCGRAW